MTRKADIDFEQLFKAHDTIRDLGCRIENMYGIAAETGSKEEIADAAAEMQKHINELFLRRARFDLFCFRELDTRERKVLELRCDRCMGWKSIAAELEIAVTTAKRIFDEVSQKAEKYGGFF